MSSISGNKKHPPQDDVTLKSCDLHTDGTFQPHVAITNHSSGLSDYVITVTFLATDGTTQLGTGHGHGRERRRWRERQRRWRVGELSANGQSFTCKLTDVERFASGTTAPVNP